MILCMPGSHLEPCAIIEGLQIYHVSAPCCTSLLNLLSLSSATSQGALSRNGATERVVLKRVKTRVEVRSTHHRSSWGFACPSLQMHAPGCHAVPNLPVAEV